ncbi:hypothetical protein [Chitinophaga filiformis]|uniref:Uncharacterized protein n=1 Tax=Chitinophaga filiformis TaxID=104663 RepID=A0ABY4I9E5_CHIFI|nr:hypothetical protein [Chitinophaga filiformis]UPK72492.1 hypothetical protein MYF79_14460 [Chitinophaga filiformis]
MTDANLTLTSSHGTILSKAVTTNNTLTLPSAAANKGKKYTIKQLAGSSSTVMRAIGADKIMNILGNQTIENEAPGVKVKMGCVYGLIIIQFHGTDWYIFGIENRGVIETIKYIV